MARRLLTNFSKGELSPKIEGRPDLAAYFEGGRTVKNWFLMRQGGLQRRPGTRFVAEIGRTVDGVIATPAAGALLLPFEATIDDAFIVQVFDAGITYFFKNKARIDSTPGNPVSVQMPYGHTLMPQVHFTQSVDVMYLFHNSFQQRRLSRFADDNWSLDTITYDPSPSFEDDTDVGTIANASISFNVSFGTVTVTASNPVFLAADVGRIIVAGPQTGVATGRVLITAFSSATSVTGTVLDPVSAGVPYSIWKLRLSPQTTLDPDKKAPAGSTVTLVAGANAFRAEDVGKYISIYAGLVKITSFTSATTVGGQLVVEMTGTSDVNPAAAPAGAWTLEVASWSNENGFPGTGEFFGGRLGQARTPKQPTTFWLSAPDSYEDYGVGTTAERAVEYTIASRQLNRIEWLADNRDLFIGTAGSEHRAEGGREGEPIGGDIQPRVRRLTPEGSAPIQPTVSGRKVIFIDRSRTKVFVQVYDVESDEFDTVELTGAADHIMGTGVRLGPIGVQRRLDPRIFFVTEDGELVTLTYSPREKVIGFSRIITDGAFEAVAVIPNPTGQGGAKNPPAGLGFPNDQVWVVVKRTINGVDRRFIEVFEDNHESLTGRKWTSLQTDSAVVYNGASTNVLTGLGHLEGKTIDVVADGGYRGTFVVSGAQVVLPEPFTQAEGGLHYDSLAETMRPAIEGQIIEGLPRSWNSLWVRVKDTLGGLVNGSKIRYAPSALGSLNLYTGDRKVDTKGWDTEGRIKIEQKEPYPMELLAVFGDLEVGQHD
jgi:hypothetical protein